MNAQRADELLSAADFTGVALNALEQNILLPAVEAARASFADQPLLQAKLIQTTSTSAQARAVHLRPGYTGGSERSVPEPVTRR
ncbi:MAG: hypothetical protein ACFHWZ_09185 [Phycisphaerales bacterium]